MYIVKETEMAKKTAILTAVLLAVGTVAIIICTNCSVHREFLFPETVTVFFPEKHMVETIKFDDFIVGCIYGRIPQKCTYEPETLRAMSVVQRTMALYSVNAGKGGNMGADFTVCEDFPYVSPVDCGLSHPLRETLDSAVSDSGFLTKNRLPANISMCVISAGITDEEGDSPELELPGDVLAEGFSGSSAFTPKEVRNLLGVPKAPLNAPGEWFSNAVYNDSGTLSSIEFCGRKFTGTQIREAFGLRSTAISVEYAEDNFRFSTKGLGNNCGMSLHTTELLAEDGKSAEEILAYFFPGTDYKR